MRKTKNTAAVDVTVQTKQPSRPRNPFRTRLRLADYDVPVSFVEQRLLGHARNVGPVEQSRGASHA